MLSVSADNPIIGQPIMKMSLAGGIPLTDNMRFDEGQNRNCSTPYGNGVNAWCWRDTDSDYKNMHISFKTLPKGCLLSSSNPACEDNDDFKNACDAYSTW